MNRRGFLGSCLALASMPILLYGCATIPPEPDERSDADLIKAMFEADNAVARVLSRSPTG